MKTFIFTLLSIFIFNSNAIAQLEFNDFLKTLPNTNSGTNLVTKKTVVVKGSPYLNDDWRNATIFASGKITKPLSIRLNFADNLIEVNNNGIVYLDFPQINEIKFLDSKAVFRNGFPFSESEEIERGMLLEVIYDGEIKIIKKHTVKLFEAVATYGTANQENVYRKSDDVLVLFPDKSYKDIRLRSKDILRLFDKKHHKQIKNFVKKNNLSYKAENEVSIIMKFAEGL